MIVWHVKASLMQPYFYKIFHKPTQKYYVGSQYGKKSNSNNFWISYFTSSSKVKQLIEEFGKDSFEIIEIQQRDDARAFEAKFIIDEFKMLGKEEFKNIYINVCKTPGIIIGKEARKRSSDRMKGNNLGKFRKITDEYRKVAREKSKGNTNVRNYKWWTNGIEYKRAIECPEEGFILGSMENSKEQKEKISKKLKGKPKSVEHKRQLSLSAKNRKFNNATNTIWIINVEGVKKRINKNETIPEGFKRGMTNG